jgi:hypothetical protein
MPRPLRRGVPRRPSCPMPSLVPCLLPALHCPVPGLVPRVGTAAGRGRGRSRPGGYRPGPTRRGGRRQHLRTRVDVDHPGLDELRTSLLPLGGEVTGEASGGLPASCRGGRIWLVRLSLPRGWLQARNPITSRRVTRPLRTQPLRERRGVSVRTRIAGEPTDVGSGLMATGRRVAGRSWRCPGRTERGAGASGCRSSSRTRPAGPAPRSLPRRGTGSAGVGGGTGIFDARLPGQGPSLGGPARGLVIDSGPLVDPVRLSAGRRAAPCARVGECIGSSCGSFRADRGTARRVTRSTGGLTLCLRSVTTPRRRRRVRRPGVRRLLAGHIHVPPDAVRRVGPPNRVESRFGWVLPGCGVANRPLPRLIHRRRLTVLC